MDLKGIYPALTTPFAPDGSVAIPRLRENIARYNKTRLAGYVLNGSTGESVLLRWDEIERVWEAARQAAAPEKLSSPERPRNPPPRPSTTPIAPRPSDATWPWCARRTTSSRR